MDFASIIVGVAVAGASAAQGGGVDPAITDSVTSVAQDQATALVQYVLTRSPTSTTRPGQYSRRRSSCPPSGMPRSRTPFHRKSRMPLQGPGSSSRPRRMA